MKILSSAAFSVLGGSVDTKGGAGGGNNGGTAPSPAGGNGRVVVGTTASNGGVVATNATVVAATGEAPLAGNPYARPPGGALTPLTPLIAPSLFGGLSMIGGANSYGLLPTDVLSDPRLAAAIAGAPAGARAFLDLSAVGPRGFENTVPGYKFLTMVNFGTDPLDRPELMGVGLQTFGFADDYAFGGSGAANILTALAPAQVFSALVPDVPFVSYLPPGPVVSRLSAAAFGDVDVTPSLNTYQFGYGGQTFSVTFGAEGGVAYDTAAINDVPEPHSMAILGMGLAGLGLLRRFTQPGSGRPSDGTNM